MDKKKLFQIEFRNGSIWQIDAGTIAELAAKHFAKNNNSIYKDELENFFNDPYSALDWMEDHAKWSEISKHATLIKKADSEMMFKESIILFVEE